MLRSVANLRTVNHCLLRGNRIKGSWTSCGEVVHPRCVFYILFGGWRVSKRGDRSGREDRGKLGRPSNKPPRRKEDEACCCLSEETPKHHYIVLILMHRKESLIEARNT